MVGFWIRFSVRRRGLPSGNDRRGSRRCLILQTGEPLTRGSQGKLIGGPCATRRPSASPGSDRTGRGGSAAGPTRSRRHRRRLRIDWCIRAPRWRKRARGGLIQEADVAVAGGENTAASRCGCAGRRTSWGALAHRHSRPAVSIARSGGTSGSSAPKRRQPPAALARFIAPRFSPSVPS